MQVGNGRQTEIQVFDGKVELYEPGPAGLPPRLALTAGRGVCLDPAGQIKEIAADGAAYPSVAEVNRRIGAEWPNGNWTGRPMATKFGAMPRATILYFRRPATLGARPAKSKNDGRQYGRCGHHRMPMDGRPLAGRETRWISAASAIACD